MIMIMIMGIIWKKNNDKFQILNTYKIGADNFQSVTLQVVVNNRSYDDKKMIYRIKDFYCKENGEPDELKIYLYKTRNQFEKAQFYTKMFFEDQ